MTCLSRAAKTSGPGLQLAFASWAVLALWFLPVVLDPPVIRAQILDDMSHEIVAVELPRVEKLAKQDVVSVLSRAPESPYNGIVFSARTDAPEIEGWVRFLSDDGEWSPWHEMRVIRSATDETVMGGYRSDIFHSGHRFELKFAVASGYGVGYVRAGTFDNRLDEEDHSANPPSNKAGYQNVVEIEPPALIRRSEWAAEPFIGQPVPLSSSPYQFMTFHHAAGFSATTREEGLAQVKAIQDLHQEVRGWSDIGYHFVIDRGGRLYQGRPFLNESATLESAPALALGAHVGGSNTGNVGICLLGCYHPPEGAFCREEITTQAYDTFIRMFAFLSDAYGILPDLIQGHRDFSSTACPGDNNYVLLPQIRTDTRDLIVTGVERPDGFALAPMYPNPVSSTAIVRYYLDHDGNVKLSLYDALGREVRTVVSEFQEGGTWYTADVNVESLAAGIYVYRLRVEGFGRTSADLSATAAIVH